MKTILIILTAIIAILFLLIDWHISVQIFNGYEQNQLVLDDYILILKVIIAGSSAIYFINSLQKDQKPANIKG